MLIGRLEIKIDWDVGTIGSLIIIWHDKKQKG